MFSTTAFNFYYIKQIGIIMSRLLLAAVTAMPFMITFKGRAVFVYANLFFFSSAVISNITHLLVNLV